MLGRVASWCFRHRRRVLLLWFVALVAVIVLGQNVGGDTTTSFALPNVESQQAFQLLQSRFPSRAGDSAEVIVEAPAGVRAPAVEARMASLLARLAHAPHVTAVISPYSGTGPQISPSGTIAFATVQFDRRARDLPKSAGQHVVDEVQAANGRGVQIDAGGSVVQTVVRPKAPSSELLGLLAAVVILLIAFGSVIAMGLPILKLLHRSVVINIDGDSYRLREHQARNRKHTSQGGHR